MCKSKIVCLWVFVLVLATASAFADESQNTPSLFYVGHATTLIKGKEATILTDPFFREKILLGLKRRVPAAMKPEELPLIDIILVSHTHPDHYDWKALLALEPKPIVVMPWKRGKKLRKKGFQVTELRPWETCEVKGVHIKAVPARHMFGHCLGYVFEIDGRKIYFTGDTDMYKGIKKLEKEKIDYMLMPYGGTPIFGSIWTTKRAAKAVSMIKPKVCVPIHWETVPNWLTKKTIQSPDRFIALIKKRAPETDCVVMKPGEEKPLKVR